MSISNCDSSPRERRGRQPSKQQVDGRAHILEARERRYFSFVVPKRVGAKENGGRAGLQ